MSGRVVGPTAGAVFLVLLMVTALPAQSSDITTLQGEVAGLRKQLEGVQRELQELKSLVRERAGSPSAEARPITVGLGDAPFKGARDARVTLVEFTDYQCPFCARHHRDTLPRVLEAYVKTGKLKYVVRDYPLEAIHPAAVKAAEAPHCASEAGRYWQMHERLFAHPRGMAPDDLVLHAEAVGLDSRVFRHCLESGKYAGRVRQARAEGERAGVRGTPMFFLGLTEPSSDTITAVTTIRGAQPYARFEEAIEKLLAFPR
jgi:protein-disulfide isomerase